MTEAGGTTIEGAASSPVVDAIRGRWGDAVVDAVENNGQWRVELGSGDSLIEIVTFLKDGDLGFDFLVDVTALDHYGDPLGAEARFRAIYVLRSMKRREELVLKVPVTEDDCTAPSMTSLFATANWLEREAYDMFGIEFEGHPNMRRIMMPEIFTDWPLRKDFPMEGKMTDQEWAAWIIQRAQRVEDEG